MKITNVDPNQLMLDLEAQRKSLNISYQNIADACEVSQATIIRVFKRQTEPTCELLQKIAAAVHYDAKPAPVILEGYTKEEYIHYLQTLLERREDDYKIREAKAEARHNMIVNQKTRTIRYLTLAVIFLAIGFVAWLVLDILHPTMGWFQREVHYYASHPDADAAGLLRIISNICLNIF